MDSTGKVTFVADADAVSDPALRSATVTSVPAVRIPATVVADGTVADVGPAVFDAARGPTLLAGCPTRVIATCTPYADAAGSAAEARVLPQTKRTGSMQIRTRRNTDMPLLLWAWLEAAGMGPVE